MSRTAHSGEETGEGDQSGKKADIVVLDEINYVMDFRLIPVEEVLETVKGKPEGLELILRGRGAPEEIIEAASCTTGRSSRQ